MPYYGANGQQGLIDRALFDEPLILLAEDGGNFDDFATRPIAYRIDGPAWVNNHAHILRARKGTDQSFLFWSLVHKDIRKYIAGGTRTKLTQAELRRVEVAVPQYDHQAKIAEVLDTLHAAIRGTEAVVAKLRAMKQGLLHDLLTRGIDANGDLRPPQPEAPHLYHQTPLGWLPKEWEPRDVFSVSSTVTSGSRDWARYYAENGAVFVRIGNLTREHVNLRLGSLIYVRPPMNADGQRTSLEAGDVLISITADLGIVGVIPEDFGEAYINQHIALVRPNANVINARFLGHFLASPVSQNHLSKLNDAGAKAGLNLPTIRGLPVMLPERSEQDAIAERLDEIDGQIAGTLTELAKLKSLKSGLMDDLLTGRVPVTPLL